MSEQEAHAGGVSMIELCWKCHEPLGDDAVIVPNEWPVGGSHRYHRSCAPAAAKGA